MTQIIYRLRMNCPEFFQLVLRVPLFNPSGQRGYAKDEDTPELMAHRFAVPYLGKIPMDPNLMIACENGQSFLETFPSSVAAGPLKQIVENLLLKCQERSE